MSHVWHLIKLHEFLNFWTLLAKSEHVQGASPETDVIKWTFRDGTVQELEQEEHSAIDHFISYSVISSKIPLLRTFVSFLRFADML
ncbi:hypothetical protein N7G274_008026 [Stereocaulon virgatum]|uniref:Uncharacterized protein n=1 Tax=Stereocaulon virgatum TaxID=373712 RepID=A0ABR4A164_9LECA